MSGITTGVGLFSGIDTASLISQLLALEARPRTLAQQRILQLQQQQSAYLDINSKLSALRTAATTFRTQFTFQAMGATSTDDSVLTATASRSAVPGSYSFLVDRLVSSQQMLSRGYADKDVTALAAESFTFESIAGRLDRDLALADLNDGEGIERGKIKITQGSETVTVDLSKSVTVNDVIEAIDGAGLDVTARAAGDHLVLSGGADFTVADASGYSTATSLGIAGTSTSGTLTGSAVYGLTENTTLRQLNDGNGVFVGNDIGSDRYDFRITLDREGADELVVDVNIGSVYDEEYEEIEGPVSSVGGVIDRINEAIEAAIAEANDNGATHDYTGEVVASISDGRIVITNNSLRDIDITEKDSTGTTAEQLGILKDTSGSITGDRILAGLNTTLLSSINGGGGVSGDGDISFTSRDGTNFVVDVSGAETIEELIALINDDAGNAGRLTASLNPVGHGLLITDTTSGGSNLIITGDSADSLGISTDVAGVAEDSVTGSNLQHQYLSMATRVDDLNNGGGIGTGEFRITDGNSVSFTVDIGSDTETVYDLIKEINAQSDAQNANVVAAINDKGDGIVIRERGGSEPNGAAAIIVEDISGNVAGNLKIEGEAVGIDGDNYLDGSAEVTVEFEATDTLQDIADKINDAGAPLRASIIDDGTGSNPYRLNFTAVESGVAGRFIFDDNGFGLDMDSLNEGQDALAFFGSTDPARAVMLTNSENTLDGVIPGVTIDLHSASEDPVTINVTRDNEAIESAIDSFITAYNALVDRIGYLTRYDPETESKGPLLGESTLSALKSALSRTAISTPLGVDDEFNRLTEVGVKVIEGGKLSLDRDKLREAMDQDFQAVADLFAARDVIPPDSETEIDDGVFVRNTSNEEEFERLGIIFMFEELADNYLDSVDGILTQKDKTFADKIELQEKRIEHFDELLEIKRQRLEAQFLAMEQALASLQTQQSSLSSLQQNLG